MAGGLSCAGWARVVGVLAMVVALLGMPAGAVAETGGQRTSVLVTATVLKHASLKILAQPAAVVVTAEDVARGYVDTSAPTEFSVKANTESFLLDFAASGDFMRQIIVFGLANEVQLSPAGGAIAQRSAPPASPLRGVLLSFRFVLSETVRPGMYQWPIRLSVTPL